MKNNAYRQIIEDPKKTGLIIAGILLLTFVFWVVFRDKTNPSVPITEGQIQIVKGDEVITINQNGLVEYRSKDREYTEIWDASQIRSFFSLMEKKARRYLSGSASGGDCGYKVFMYLNGKLITMCLDSQDEDMEEYIEPVIDRYSDISLSDYFDDDTDNDEYGDEDGDVFDGVINFPTATPIPGRPTATPTPYSIYNVNTNYAPVQADCETWSGDIVNGRAIISNTFCTVISTPTPTQ